MKLSELIRRISELIINDLIPMQNGNAEFYFSHLKTENEIKKLLREAKIFDSYIDFIYEHRAAFDLFGLSLKHGKHGTHIYFENKKIWFR